MRKPMPTTALAAAAALALLAAACGDDSDDAAVDEPPEDEAPAVVDSEGEIDEEALQAILDEWRERADAFGATLSIRIPSEEDIHLASGIDGRDPDTPMPTDGTYRIDVTTMTFTAALVMQLVDEGVVALDDTVEAWLPEFPDGDEITVAMLLDHTSGIGSWIDAPDYNDTIVGDLTRSFAPEEVLARHLEQPRTGDPGEGYSLSDGGYVALGLLIERVLEQDLATVIEHRIAGPLSLDDTSLSDGFVEVTRHGWFSLDDEPDRPLDALEFPGQAAATSLWAAGAAISSSPDLLDWTDALYSGSFLGDEATTAMTDMRNQFSPRGHYGLGTAGYCLDRSGCDGAEVDLVGHGGNYAGSAVRIGYHVDSGASFVMHANVTPIEPEQFANLVADVLAELPVPSAG